MHSSGLTKWITAGAFGLAAVALQPANVSAESGAEIDAQVDATLAAAKDTHGLGELLDDAKGVLVFPSIIGGAIGIGAEYGEGALRAGGKTVNYYSAAAGSIGFQLGGQARSDVILFMNDDVLKTFESSSGWEAGVDGTITVIETAASGSLTTTTHPDPILALSFGQKGLMAGFSLTGAKYTKIVP
jgi:lipid-binding SYLF domain-containing protein